MICINLYYGERSKRLYKRSKKQWFVSNRVSKKQAGCLNRFHDHLSFSRTKIRFADPIYLSRRVPRFKSDIQMPELGTRAEKSVQEANKQIKEAEKTNTRLTKKQRSKAKEQNKEAKQRSKAKQNESLKIVFFKTLEAPDTCRWIPREKLVCLLKISQ